MNRTSITIGAALLLLSTACKDGTGPAPVPELASVTPAATQVGASGVTLTVTGTGFREESRVMWNGTALATTYVKKTELQAVVPPELLQSGGTANVSVYTPPPGGGGSAPRTVTVAYPAPVLSALSVDTGTVGNTPTVTVTGTGFSSATRVLWGGQEVGTTFRSATEVSFMPPMSQAGTAQVAVRNPEPGGGTSAPRQFTVYNPQPVITLLPSQGATAGRPGFTLSLHGTGFVQGSMVQVNGQARGATFVSSTRLEVPISSADVAAPGTLQVRVVNGGPVERASSPATVTVRTLGAATATVQRMPLDANDLVWNAGTGRLYLSMPASAGALGNTVAAVDPVTATVTKSVFVGSEPGRMALSAGGEHLYVGLNGAGAVRRVDLPGLTPALQWSIGAGHAAGDIAVVPGQPRNVVVSIHRPGISPPLEGVQLYEDGAARGTASPGHTGGARIEFLNSPSTLYGYNNSSTGFQFFTMAVDGAGVRHTHETGGLISGFYVDIVGAAGRIYGYDGSVVDAERRVRLGKFNVGFYGYGLAADPATGRVFTLGDNQILVHDMNTFQQLASIPLPAFYTAHPAHLASRMVRWGTDGLAFLDEDELIIVRSPIVAP